MLAVWVEFVVKLCVCVGRLFSDTVFYLFRSFFYWSQLPPCRARMMVVWGVGRASPASLRLMTFVFGSYYADRGESRALRTSCCNGSSSQHVNLLLSLELLYLVYLPSTMLL